MNRLFIVMLADEVCEQVTRVWPCFFAIWLACPEPPVGRVSTVDNSQLSASDKIPLTMVSEFHLNL